MSTELTGKSFLSTDQLDSSAFRKLVDQGLAYKSSNSGWTSCLQGKVVGLLFFNSSLRTRTSMAAAITKLGGTPLIFDIGQGVWGLETKIGVTMLGDKAEHIKEAIPVLSQYVDILGIRCFPDMTDFTKDSADEIFRQMASLSQVPVINMESAFFHPLQATADMMTIKENFSDFHKPKVVLSWANHPKVLPMAVPNSFALAASQCGINLTIANPKGYNLDSQLLSKIETHCAATGGQLNISHELDEALSGAHVVYAKSWGSIPSYGKHQEELTARKSLSNWMIDEHKMKLTDRGLFMHCLPVRRNVVVSDGVIDGPQSRVIEQAKNRLYGQIAILEQIGLGL